MVLTELRDIIQNDVGQRGLRKNPERNLINAWPNDFAAACRSLAEHPQPKLAVVTGFFIPTATPPAGETDGPLGALFLARALTPLGIAVSILTDDFCVRALETGLAECGLRKSVPLITLPRGAWTPDTYRQHLAERLGSITHSLAIERVGPNDQERCHTMRGRDITDSISPAHYLFLPSPSGRGVGGEGIPITIGIGDGGNEIGMGKIPRAVIADNIPNGQLVACRIATEHLIVCGVSNWGAYALSAGVAHLRKQTLDASLFDPAREQEILADMVRAGPLVDGVTGQPSATVDGLTWQQYTDVLVKIGTTTRNEIGN